jgi:large-conductance mechanosensitive channel
MDQTMRTSSSEAADTRGWIARIIVAVILGEAIWGLIVSVMNNVIVPWLGDVMGQSSGLPTSFTQRPYNYPDLFVSVLEFGIAALVAAVLNYFVQGRTSKTIQAVKNSPPAAAAQPVRVFPQPTTTAALTQTPSPYTPPPPVTKTEPVAEPAPAPVSAPPPVAPPPPVRPVASIPLPPPVTESVVAEPLPTAPVAGPAATKPPSAPKAEPAAPKKPKNVYYNIVGEPMPSDDD